MIPNWLPTPCSMKCLVKPIVCCKMFYIFCVYYILYSVYSNCLYSKSCIFPTELLTQVEYTVGVELNITDVTTLDYLRSILSNGSVSLALGHTVNVTHIDITTGQNGAPSDLNSMDANVVNLNHS